MCGRQHSVSSFEINNLEMKLFLELVLDCEMQPKCHPPEPKDTFILL